MCRTWGVAVRCDAGVLEDSTPPRLLPAGDALASAGKIAAHTDAVLLCENAFARLDRGAGLPCPRRLPYFPQDAAAELAKYDLLLLVDTRSPVATFGYK
jgi:acetolactate synthase-1/2/3 large subunit